MRLINGVMPYNLPPIQTMREMNGASSIVFSPARKSKPTLDEYNLFQWHIVTRHSQQNSLIDPALSERTITGKVFNDILTKLQNKN